jgi:multidrug efflux system membrane fusion protein
MRRVVWAVVFLALLVGGALAYRGFVAEHANSQTAAGPAPRPAPAVPVRVAAAERRTVPVRLDAIGTVQVFASVSVKSRIDGQIAEVKVKDGQYVKAGDTLFLLDARSAEAQVHQTEAQLARDKAQLVNARRDVDRYAPLLQKDFVSHQQYDTALTAAQALEASVRSDEAALENAKVLLSYYTINSPITGRLGMVSAKAGNNVKANDVPFLSVNQVRPIYALFSVSERELPAIRAALAQGAVTVSAVPAGDKGPPVQGKLAFFDNSVDAATGTIGLRGIFDNDDERLWPGQFVNVSMTLSQEPDAVVVPQAAVQIGQNGTFIFVVRDENTAEARKVGVSRVVDGMSVIQSGLEPGERVVVDGQLRLSNGSRVEIRPAAEPAPAGKTS